MSERAEALWRIPVLIIAVIILEIWETVTQIVIVVHWFLTIITGKRNKNLAKFTNHWINYQYRAWRYLGLTTNERPFPFNDYKNPMEAVVMNKVRIRVKKTKKRKK